MLERLQQRRRLGCYLRGDGKHGVSTRDSEQEKKPETRQTIHSRKPSRSPSRSPQQAFKHACFKARHVLEPKAVRGRHQTCLMSKSSSSGDAFRSSQSFLPSAFSVCNRVSKPRYRMAAEIWV
eukprot:3936967-Rhodomonas_salina.1